MTRTLAITTPVEVTVVVGHRGDTAGVPRPVSAPDIAGQICPSHTRCEPAGYERPDTSHPARSQRALRNVHERDQILLTFRQPKTYNWGVRSKDVMVSMLVTNHCEPSRCNVRR
ncbi:hypothetical protein MMUR_12050 [Mycolicibacterium murale]|uniref:Uncharacterized protein n=1 Tax=Mycolicibacterium murale TaxID=182220 RepID=A0A7I9WHN5_9MYCO|nr:hypothetical protein MMUR_12050 [Mycolicibacterium murale]